MTAKDSKKGEPARAVRRVQVYRVQSMVMYEVESVDDVDALTQALGRARSDMENPINRLQPDCKYVALMPSGAKRGGYSKRRREPALRAKKR